MLSHNTDTNLKFVLINSKMWIWHITEVWEKYTDMNLSSGAEEGVTRVDELEMLSVLECLVVYIKDGCII